MIRGLEIEVINHDTQFGNSYSLNEELQQAYDKGEVITIKIRKTDNLFLAQTCKTVQTF